MSALAETGHAIIDADFRAQQADVATLAPYLPDAWIEYLGIGRDMAGHGIFQFSLPTTCYRVPGPATTAAARDADPVAEAKSSLDRDGIAHAVLSPNIAHAVSGLSYPAFAAELARAANDWTIDTWLEADERFLGSILVAPRDPAAAAAEVRRVGSHPRMVQVVFSSPPWLLGNRALHPIYEAANELSLPVRLEAGGWYAGLNRGPTGGGDPGTMFEYRLGTEYTAQPQLLSMIGEGVFERFPQLRLVLDGFGVAWLPSLLWAMDAESAGATPPSEIVRDRVRLTTTGVAVPHDAQRLVDLLALVDAKHLLLFSSAEGGAAIVDALPDAWRPPVLHGNAEQLFDLGAGS